MCTSFYLVFTKMEDKKGVHAISLVWSEILRWVGLVLYAVGGLFVALLYVKMYPATLPCIQRDRLVDCKNHFIVIDTLFFWVIALTWPVAALITVLPVATILLVSVF